MQSKTSQTTGRGLLLGIPSLALAGLLVLAGCGLFSCGKRTMTTSPDTGMEKVARLLQGEKRSGSLTGAESANSLALNYNNGSQYILVDKLPGLDNIGAFSFTSTELITSEYGIVIKDLCNDRLLFLANNDEESLRRMKEARAMLNEEINGSAVFGTIFGTTLVNPPSYKKGI
ncbi:MAG TPA: hypothetical protein VGM31_03795 [Puia sp.]|jgi:hypothetical protein